MNRRLVWADTDNAVNARLDRWRASREQRWDKPIKPMPAAARFPAAAEGIASGEYTSTTVCWVCGETLPLTEEPYDVQVGHYVWAFAMVPGYRCKRCREIYLPESVVALMNNTVAPQLERYGAHPDRLIDPHRNHPHA